MFINAGIICSSLIETPFMASVNVSKPHMFPYKTEYIFDFICLDENHLPVYSMSTLLLLEASRLTTHFGS